MIELIYIQGSYLHANTPPNGAASGQLVKCGRITWQELYCRSLHKYLPPLPRHTTSSLVGGCGQVTECSQWKGRGGHRWDFQAWPRGPPLLLGAQLLPADRNEPPRDPG